MRRNIRVRGQQKEVIDLERLARALLRAAREREEQRQAPQPVKKGARHDR